MKTIHIVIVILSILIVGLSLSIYFICKKFSYSPIRVFPSTLRLLSSHLVVAFCGEDIRWIANETEFYDQIFIYTKCQGKIPSKLQNHPKIVIKDLPNIGSCDFVYLHHIVKCWDSLPYMVSFSKGTYRSNYKHLYTYRKDKSQSYNPKKYSQFELNDWRFSNHKERKMKFHRANIRGLGKWLKFNIGEKGYCILRNGQAMIHGGAFSALSKDIKRHGKEMYEKLMKPMSHANEEIDHYVERFWGPLLTTYSPRVINLCLVGIFKNESHIMKEWLDHYERQGVCQFFLIDNGSTDNYEPIVKNRSNVKVVKDSKRHAQTELYNKHFLQTVKSFFDWVLVVDLDEFVYVRGWPNIPSYLKSLDSNIRSIQLTWKMFGSNGHTNQPESAIHGFTKRSPIGWKTETKMLCSCHNLKKLGIHTHQLKGKGKDLRFPEIMSEESLRKAPLHINHYAIQSKDWFFKVKCTRGDVDSKASENVRNESYFKEYDRNGIVDGELSSLTPK